MASTYLLIYLLDGYTQKENTNNQNKLINKKQTHLWLMNAKSKVSEATWLFCKKREKKNIWAIGPSSISTYTVIMCPLRSII